MHKNAENTESKTTITTEIVESSTIARTVTVKEAINKHALPEFSQENREIIIEAWPHVEKHLTEVIIINDFQDDSYIDKFNNLLISNTLLVITQIIIFNRQVGLTSYMDLFKVSPEIRMNFAFLQHYQTEDEKFYSIVSKHSLRVFAVITKLVKEVRNFIL